MRYIAIAVLRSRKWEGIKWLPNPSPLKVPKAGTNQKGNMGGGGVPNCAWRATFVVTISILTPDFPSPKGAPCGGIFALRAHCALLLDYVPPKEPRRTPLGNALSP